MNFISVANIKYVDSENFEEVRGYDDLTVQTNCFIFQWFESQQTLVIPMHRIDYLTTSQEEDS